MGGILEQPVSPTALLLAWGRGETDAFESLYANLPASFHSKENELYFKGEMIRRLPTGQCFVAYRGKTTRITVPAPKRKS